MKLSFSEKRFLIDKLHRDGWKDKDIKKHLEDLDRQLRELTIQKKIEVKSIEKSNDYFREEFRKL